MWPGHVEQLLLRATWVGTCGFLRKSWVYSKKPSLLCYSVTLSLNQNYNSGAVCTFTSVVGGRVTIKSLAFLFACESRLDNIMAFVRVIIITITVCYSYNYTCWWYTNRRVVGTTIFSVLLVQKIY